MQQCALPLGVASLERGIELAHVVAARGQQIAQQLPRLLREYQRNSTQVRSCLTYCPSKAQERRNGRLRRSRRGAHHDAWQYARVESLLRQQWSPEQIARTLRKQEEFQISFQSIYRHVRRDWRAGGELYLELRRRYKRRKRHYGLERRGRLQGKRMIDERPAEIETRQVPGHWEIDTVMGASWEKPCIVTLVERTSGYVLIGKLPNRTTKALNQRTISLMQGTSAPFLTITSDNVLTLESSQMWRRALPQALQTPVTGCRQPARAMTRGLPRQQDPLI